jgi:hypothetical protein
MSHVTCLQVECFFDAKEELPANDGMDVSSLFRTVEAFSGHVNGGCAL